MAMVSGLSFKSAHDPLQLELYIVDHISCRYGCPLSWVALFNTEHIDAENFILLSTTEEATKTIQSRSESLALAFGESWSAGIDQFMARLQTAEYVQLDLRDWYGDEQSEEFDGALSSQISQFSVPFYTGKRHLLSRRKKVNKVWSPDRLSEFSAGVFE